MLFEADLIINNASLTYVYLNTIKKCLTPNHLLLVFYYIPLTQQLLIR